MIVHYLFVCINDDLWPSRDIIECSFVGCHISLKYNVRGQFFIFFNIYLELTILWSIPTNIGYVIQCTSFNMSKS